MLSAMGSKAPTEGDTTIVVSGKSFGFFLSHIFKTFFARLLFLNLNAFCLMSATFFVQRRRQKLQQHTPVAHLMCVMHGDDFDRIQFDVPSLLHRN